MPIQLLGGTKIRLDPTLLASFGASGTTGLQGSSEANAVDQAVQVLLRQTRTEDGEGFDYADMAAEVARGGVILSEKDWTTLTNDAFMLAGVHRRRDFHFVGEVMPGTEAGYDPEQEILFTACYNRRPTQTVAKQVAAWNLFLAGIFATRDIDEVRISWGNFIRENPQILWNDAGVPRVFLRELMLLKCFRYEANVHPYGLYFTPTANTDGADLSTFLRFLRSPDSGGFDNGGGVYTPERKQRMLRAAYRFIFP